MGHSLTVYFGTMDVAIKYWNHVFLRLFFWLRKCCSAQFLCVQVLVNFPVFKSALAFTHTRYSRRTVSLPCHHWYAYHEIKTLLA